MSNHPDDRSVTGQNTQPIGMGAGQGAAPVAGPHDRERHEAGRDADGQSSLDSAVDSLAEPDNRAKLLMAIAFMTALTLLLTLGILFDHLLDDGGEPVLVDGVPCLVEEGPEGEEAVLYCQR